MAAVSSWCRPQVGIFIVGFISYASTYSLRKPLAVIKVDLQESLGFTASQLGCLDLALLLPYALLQTALGHLGDQYGARKIYSCGMVLSALSMMMFSLFTSFWVFIALLFMNGAAQSVCWPNCSRVVGSWFSESARTKMYGLFGACTFFGALGSTATGVYFRQTMGWHNVFLVPSAFVLFMGICVYLWYTEAEETKSINGSKDRSEAKGGGWSSFVQVLKIPVVIEGAVTNICLKSVRYCVYMWMPLYLHKQLGYSEASAGMFATTFDLGGVMGSLCMGYVLERFFKGRHLVGVALGILLSAVSFLLFHFTSSLGAMTTSVCLFLCGVFNCACDPILGAALPHDLGQKGGRNAVGAVTGLINGLGGVGTFLQGPLVGLIADVLGWQYVIHYMTAASLLGTVCSMRAHRVYCSAYKNEESEGP